MRLAEAAQDRYGFKDFKLKAAYYGEQEIDTARALKNVSLTRALPLTRTARLLDEAITLCQGLQDV